MYNDTVTLGEAPLIGGKREATCSLLTGLTNLTKFDYFSDIVKFPSTSQLIYVI